MSRNDQLLVKEYKGKFYVFDVMAESWYDALDGSIPSNQLSIKEAKGVFRTRKAAHKFAHKLDQQDEFGGSEYGVVDEVLFKDGAPVNIVDSEDNNLQWVRGIKCPACNKSGLFIGSAGYITCSHFDCPNPDYAAALAEREKRLVEEAIAKAMKGKK